MATPDTRMLDHVLWRALQWMVPYIMAAQPSVNTLSVAPSPNQRSYNGVCFHKNAYYRRLWPCEAGVAHSLQYDSLAYQMTCWQRHLKVKGYIIRYVPTHRYFCTCWRCVTWLVLTETIAQARGDRKRVSSRRQRHLPFTWSKTF